MKILFASSEAAPFAKTGGLADVAGSLPPALAALGHDVRLVMPRYRPVDPDRFKLIQAGSLSVPFGSSQERCNVREGRLGKLPVYFIEKDAYFDRSGLYQANTGDFPDNAERFAFFSRAIPELCLDLNFRPDIIHGNDWQTGLVSFFLNAFYRKETLFERTKSVFTVHNLGYQGNFRQWGMHYLGNAWEHYTSEGLEYWGNISFLKAGLVYSDLITTVSKTYSREIQTREYGFGLDGVLRKRAADVYGIVNGIDYEEWDPAKDDSIVKKYSADRTAGKAECRLDLVKEVGLAVTDAPVIGMVTRLAVEKGLDILTEALPAIMSLGMQCIILGTGDQWYQRILAEIAERYPRQMRVLPKYDDRLARRIYAGSDLFLMPSRYEPCGLGQLIALRYGTVPVVRKTGGLADTVLDYDTGTGQGTGFIFNDYTAEALVACLRRALALYADTVKWKRLLQSCMKEDFSWDRSAREYDRVYRKAMEPR